jgi:hypothetical protein
VGDRGVILGRGRDFSLLRTVQNFYGAPPASNPMGTGDSYIGVKQPGREADHSPPFSAEAKNSEAVFALPHTSSWLGA